jgi:hypothetical protein
MLGAVLLVSERVADTTASQVKIFGRVEGNDFDIAFRLILSCDKYTDPCRNRSSREETKQSNKPRRLKFQHLKQLKQSKAAQARRGILSVMTRPEQK